MAAEMAVLRPRWLAAMVLVDPLGLTDDWTQIPNVFYADPAMVPGLPLK